MFHKLTTLTSHDTVNSGSTTHFKSSICARDSQFSRQQLVIIATLPTLKGWKSEFWLYSEQDRHTSTLVVLPTLIQRSDNQYKVLLTCFKLQHCLTYLIRIAVVVHCVHTTNSRRLQLDLFSLFRNT